MSTKSFVDTSILKRSAAIKVPRRDAYLVGTKVKWVRRLWAKYDPEDFSNFLPKGPESQKEKLVAECTRRGVSVYINDPAETATGVYAGLRAVASEVELQSRLLQVIAVETAARANRIAWLALFVGLAGLFIAVIK